MLSLAPAEVDTLEVLFIAYDPDLAEMYRMKLQLDGYWVHVVGADAAAAQARSVRPDIVFLEVPAGMPERVRILRSVRDVVRRPQLPAVILTPWRAEQFERHGGLSACDYLVRIPEAPPPR